MLGSISSVPSRFGRQAGQWLRVFLDKMLYVRSEETMAKTMNFILQSSVVCDDIENKQYLTSEWFNCKEMWCFSERNEYHKDTDTSNNSESCFQLSK